MKRISRLREDGLARHLKDIARKRDQGIEYLLCCTNFCKKPNIICPHCLITEGGMDKGLPCAALNEELDRARELAAAGLNRQRKEVTSGEKEGPPVTGGLDEPLTRQKSRPVMLGASWDGDGAS